jgi:hypothetical protein
VEAVNAKVTVDAAPAAAVVNVSAVARSECSVMVVEVVIEVAGMSACAAHVTATVRLLKSAPWLTAGVVSPADATRRQGNIVKTPTVCTVMVRVAVAVPLLVSSAVPLTPAFPHVVPLSTTEMAVDTPVKLGSTSTIWSFTAIVFVGVKAYVTAAGALIMLEENVRTSEAIVGTHLDPPPNESADVDRYPVEHAEAQVLLAGHAQAHQRCDEHCCEDEE